MSSTWSVRRVARTAGRSVGYASGMAAALLPHRIEDRRRHTAEIPEELAQALAVVLQHGAMSPRLATTMQEDPAAVLAVADALSLLASARLDSPGEAVEMT